MAPAIKKTPKSEMIQKGIASYSEKRYRPEERGSNNMKVTQLSVSRLPRLLFTRFDEERCGYGKNKRSEWKSEEEEAKSLEIEIAVGCLFGSRLGADTSERTRNRERSDADPKNRSGSKKTRRRKEARIG